MSDAEHVHVWELVDSWDEYKEYGDRYVCDCGAEWTKILLSRSGQVSTIEDADGTVRQEPMPPP